MFCVVFVVAVIPNTAHADQVCFQWEKRVGNAPIALEEGEVCVGIEDGASCNALRDAKAAERDINITQECILISGPADGDSDTSTDIDATANRGDGSVAGFLFGKVVGEAFRGISYAALTISGWFLWLAGVAFNEALDITVLRMSELIPTGGIEIAWAVIRDVMNMAFIFILLYISITTILRIGGNTRDWIVRLIIAGLLINFSLFFTRVVIDASNILANEFYKGITTSGAGGIAGAFMEPLRLTTLYDVSAGPTGTVASTDFGDTGKLLVVGVAGSAFLLITAFTFFAGALLLIIRLVMLILLMVLSPLPFVAWIVPGTAKYAKQWWDTLLNQAFFAPLFIAMLFIVVKILNASSGALVPGSGESLSGAIFGDAGAIGTVLNFVIIISLVIASLIIAKQMASTGAKGAVDFATKTAGAATFGGAAFLGRETVGRVGQAVAESKWANRLASRGGALGFAGAGVVGAGNKLGKSSVDLRGVLPEALGAGKPKKGGFKKQEEERVKRMEGYYRASGKPEEEATAAAARAGQELADITSQLSDDEIREAKERDAELKKAQENSEKTNEKLDAAVTALANAKTDEQKERLERRIEQLNASLKQNTDALEEAQGSWDDLEGTQKQYVAKSTQNEATQKVVAQQTRTSQVAVAERGLGSRSKSRRKASENVRKELSRTKEEQGTERIIEALKNQANSGNQDTGS